MEWERTALLARLQAARSVALVGPSGAGKSWLAAAVAARGDGRLALVVERPDSGPADVARALAAAARAGGLRGSAALADGADVEGVLGSLPRLLAEEDGVVTVVIDDVQNLSAEGAGRLAAALAAVEAPHRVVVTGRSLPAAVAGLVDETIGETDLRLTSEHVRALAEAAGVTVDERRAAAVATATGGWIGAAILALDPSRPIGPAAAVAAIVDALPTGDRPVLRSLAHLPLLVDGVDAALGAAGALARAHDAGLPVTRDDGGRWTLPDWVRAHLVDGVLDADVARTAAAWYRRVGEVVEATAVLLDVGAAEDAAALLDELTPAEADRLDLVDLEAVTSRLPAPVLARHPRVDLLLARACADAVLMARRAALLEGLAGRLDGAAGDDRLRREVDAERARDLARDGEAEAADALAARVLEEAGSDELYARAAACEVRGRAAAWWAATEAALTEARRWLDQSLAASRRLGSADLEAAALGFLGYGIEFRAGRMDAAAERLREAAAVIATRPRRRAMLLTFLAEVEHNAGRFVEAAAALDEAAATAAELADDRLLAYVAWERARGAGWQGRADELDACVLEVERHAAEWFEHPSGMVFLADVADLFDRVGDPVRAGRLRDRALARMATLGVDDPDVLTVAAAAEARHGDAGAALQLLERVDATGAVAPARRWRLLLLRALAALRLGDPAAPSLAAVAFDEAGRLGLDDLAGRIEPEATASLAALAGAAGSSVAARIDQGEARWTVSVLGRFEVSRSGVPVAVPTGRPAEVVKLLAARGGRAHVEVVIDALWPDEDAANGRKLLRNILTRLRRGLGDAEHELVVRDGDVVTLRPDIEVDAVRFDEAVDRALAVAGIDDEAAAAVARVAAARYRGELLPDDRYTDWVAPLRERLRGRLVLMLHLLADVAVRAGRVDEAVRHLERAIATEPLDPEGYARLESLLREAGRPGGADRVRARATEALELL